MKFRFLIVCAVMLAALVMTGCPGRNTHQKTSGAPAGKPSKDNAESSSKKPSAKMPPELEAFLKSVSQKPGEGADGESAGEQKPGEIPAEIASAAKPTAEQLLQAVRIYYGGLETVKCQGVSSTVIKHDGKIAAQQKNTPFTILFKRPNKFRMTGADSEMVSDGKTVYTYVPEAKRYSKDPAGDEVLNALVMSKPGIGIMGLLLRANYSEAISGAKLLADSTINGKDVYVLSITLKAPKGARAAQKLWIGKKDLVVYKNEVVASEKPERPKGYTGDIPRLVETTLVGTLNEFAPDAKLADARFTFKAPAGAKLAERPEPVDVMNKPAPDFAFKWPDGSQRKLSDYRGKLVLLDFWTLPDCEKQLPVLESVHKNLADVQLIAVNLNVEPDQVDEFVKQNNFTFPVVHADEPLARVAIEQYGLSAVPMMFIVDAEGVVRGGMMGIATLDEIKDKLKKSGL